MTTSTYSAMDTSKSLATDKSFRISKDTTTHQHINIEKLQNILVIWLDTDIDTNNVDCYNTIKQLKRIANNIITYTDSDQCVEFIRSISDGKICLIMSDGFAQDIVTRMHDMVQIDTIFIFKSNKSEYEEWPEIKGVFTELLPMCDALKQAVQQCKQNMIPVNIVPTKVVSESSTNFDQLDSSFIYIQVIKEILLTIDFEERHFEDFILYCRQICAGDDEELGDLDQLNRDYYSKTPISWYTRDSFLYRMLNRALRLLDTSIIVRIGFFINDLDRHIQRLHSEQFNDEHSDKFLTVYRGQGLSKKIFEEMSENKDGFISFNDFLLTSKNHEVSLNCAQQAATNPDLVGILFIMNIDAAQSITPFASISDVSYFHTEDEVLFSMHTIFRIDSIKSTDGNANLYEVTLTLSSENEKDLHQLTDRIREETFSDQKGWHRLGQLLLKSGHFWKAQEVYEILLSQTTYESDMAPIYYQLAWIKYNQRDFSAALTLYEKSLSIDQQTLSPNHMNLASSHAKIGAVRYSMGDYANALLSYEKSLEIKQKSLPSNHLELADLYHDIGMVYNNLNDYSEALSSYDQSLRIRQQALPPNHPDLSTCYNNIGMVHYNMGNYSKALSFYEKAFRIQQQTLPANHPDLAVHYNNIGMVYNNMGDYPKAIASYEKALHIRQQTPSLSHVDVATSYGNLGMMYFQVGDYSKALSSYEKSLEIRQQILPSNHSDLGDCYHNIGMVHYSTGNYPEALSYYEKALKIKKEALSPNHLSLGTTYNNLGMVYINIGDYHKALSSHEDALRIRQQSLPSNHLDLAMSFGHTGNVFSSLGEYSKALPLCQRAIDIAQQSLPPNHPHLQWYRTILENVRKNL